MGKVATKRLAALVREEIAKGIPEGKIRLVLSRKGYSQQEIESVFAMAKQRQLTVRYAIAFMIIVLIIAATALVNPQLLSTQPAAQQPAQQPAQESPTAPQEPAAPQFATATSTGDPASLSYAIPEPGAEGVAISERLVLPLSCTSSDGIACDEPVVDSFFANSTASGIARWEQWIYLRLVNRESATATINELRLSSSEAVCGSATESGFPLAAGAASGRIALVCFEPEAPRSALANLAVTYTLGGEEKKAQLLLETAQP